MAENVAAVAEGGLGLSQGAASKFAAKVFDAIDQLEPEDIASKRGNNVSLAIARLTKNDRDNKKLRADLQLRDEQIAKLVAERDEREEKKRKLQETITAAKKKNGLTRETLEQIEQEAKLL